MQTVEHDEVRQVKVAGDFSVERVNEFCYLGDLLDSEGDAGRAVTARIRKAWSCFKELAPFLTHKGIAWTLKGRVYNACVRSSVLYGSETWAVRQEDM